MIVYFLVMNIKRCKNRSAGLTRTLSERKESSSSLGRKFPVHINSSNRAKQGNMLNGGNTSK